VNGHVFEIAGPLLVHFGVGRNPDQATLREARAQSTAKAESHLTPLSWERFSGASSGPSCLISSKVSRASGEGRFARSMATTFFGFRLCGFLRASVYCLDSLLRNQNAARRDSFRQVRDQPEWMTVGRSAVFQLTSGLPVNREQSRSLPTSRLVGTYRGSRDDSFGLHSQVSFNTGSADAVQCQSRPR